MIETLKPSKTTVLKPNKTTVLPNKTATLINQVFSDKPKNVKRVSWLPEKDRRALPESLQVICSSIKNFFSKKRWYAGGPIPDELLYTKANFHLLNNIPLTKALEIAYDSVRSAKTLARTPYREDIEVLITMRVIRECEHMSIQQDHIGGLLLMYLELCEKVVLL